MTAVNATQLFMLKYLLPPIKEFFTNFKLKAVTSTATAAVMTALNNDSVTITTLTYLVTIDWVFGISVALKHKRFTSWKLKGYLYKMLFYLLLLIAAHQAVNSHPILDWLHQAIEIMIILTELKSILENSAILGFKNARKIEAKLNAYLNDKLK